MYALLLLFLHFAPFSCYCCLPLRVVPLVALTCVCVCVVVACTDSSDSFTVDVLALAKVYEKVFPV